MKRLTQLLIFILPMQLLAQDCYKLVWQDEFDYTGKPDSEKWSYDLGGSGWGNNELQNYTSSLDNSFVEDGHLHIKAIRESSANRNYSSARLVSRDKGDWLYGKIEIRAKLPSGRGTWPAIWMLPTDWEYGGWPASGEIDIMEHVGFDQDRVHGTVHTQAFNHMKGTQKGGSIIINNADTEFAVYHIVWTPEYISFFANDKEYFRFSNTGGGYQEWPFDKRFHLLLNIAIGGNWGGQEGVDNSIFPQEMVVDYVRVYQAPTQPELIGQSSVRENEEQLVYQVPYFENVIYQWNVPAGVKILNGLGTNKITVNWGSENGEISVNMSGLDSCLDSFHQMEVYVTDKSSGIEFILDSLKELPAGLNFDKRELAFSLLEDEKVRVSQLRNLTTDFYWPFDGIKDLNDHPLIKLALHSSGTAESISIALEDANGNLTEANPAALQISNAFISQSYAYLYDFNNFGNRFFNPGIVKGIHVYIKRFRSEFILEKMAAYSCEEAPPSPSNVQLFKSNDQYALWWANSLNAVDYELRYQTAPGENSYTLLSKIGHNETPYPVRFSTSRAYYSVIARNQCGESTPTRLVNVDYLSIGAKPKELALPYPNPCKNTLFIPSAAPAEYISLFDLNAKELEFTSNFTGDHIELSISNNYQGQALLVYRLNGQKYQELIVINRD